MWQLGPGYLDCPECGTSVPLPALERHHCDERHRQDHGGRLVASEADTFEAEFGRFLATPRGRFDVYYAARSRRPL
ncbi:MAG TPA: hypothetical protein VG073_05210 [Gaiellaceae bacterium]|nr:hypothetical protein [Gaiellaceae bacterium]